MILFLTSGVCEVTFPCIVQAAVAGPPHFTGADGADSVWNPTLINAHIKWHARSPGDSGTNENGCRQRERLTLSVRVPDSEGGAELV